MGPGVVLIVSRSLMKPLGKGLAADMGSALSRILIFQVILLALFGAATFHLETHNPFIDDGGRSFTLRAKRAGRKEGFRRGEST
jgi:hypothetical protein